MPELKRGRLLWSDDVGSTQADVEAAWLRLMGGPFDKKAAVSVEDFGDAMAYGMPGGYVVVCDTYPTNAGIFAAPRTLPPGAVWGVRIEPRADPVVCPVILPQGYKLYDDSRNVYMHEPKEGLTHEAASRRFIRTEWRGTVYVLCDTETRAEWAAKQYRRTPQEAIHDAVKDWADACFADTCYAVVDAVNRWYVPEGRVCRECRTSGRVHPTRVTAVESLDGRSYEVGYHDVLKCGACGEYDVSICDLSFAEREAAVRALRLYPITGGVLKFARKAGGFTRDIAARESGYDYHTIRRWEEGEASHEPAYITWLIDTLESKAWE